LNSFASAFGALAGLVQSVLVEENRKANKIASCWVANPKPTRFGQALEAVSVSTGPELHPISDPSQRQ